MSAAAKRPAIPLPERLSNTLEQHATLAGLAARVAESKARLADVAGVLPEGLRGHVRPGPVDEEGWSVLASNAAVAAKLRQLLPSLQAALQDRGWPARMIRIRIQRHP